MNKKMNRKGFTMAEVLVVVAIIVVLMSVGAVALFSHMRNLQKLEMDGQAKELFVAAQNHLTLAESQGYLGVAEFTGEGASATSTGNFGTVDTDASGNATPGIYYIIVNGGDIFGSGTGSAVLNQMLPFGSMDESARVSGSYIIRYQKDPAQVLDVFYVSTTDRRYKLDGGFKPDHYLGTGGKQSLKAYISSSTSLDLKNYDGGAVVGYYGGAQPLSLTKGAELQAPLVEIFNKEKLVIEVTDYNRNTKCNDGKNALTLVFSSGGKELQIPLFNDTSINPITTHNRVDNTTETNASTCKFTVVIDDITAQNLHFAYRKDSSDETENDFKAKGFVPGEDVTVYAIAYNNKVLTNIAQSAPQDFNSLFASRSGSTAKIGYFRHLLNLDAAVSGVAATTVTAAEQIANLDWDNFKYNNAKLGSIVSLSGSSLSTTVDGNTTFHPVDPVGTQFLYDGKDFSISDLLVSVSAGEAGLFGTYNGSIRNLVLKDFKVSNTGTGNAGALAGTVNGAKPSGTTYDAWTQGVSGVLAYNTADATTLGVTSKSGHAGGLVGKMTAGTVDMSAAAVYVSTTDAGNAGGLIGLTDGAVTVSNSYSGGHTEDAKYRNLTTENPQTEFNVLSKSGNAGGLIGAAAGASLTVSKSYSTASAKSDASANTFGAGGLIGNTGAATVTINNSYATGLVLTGDKATTGAFVALSTSETATGTGNQFLSSLNTPPEDLTSLGYTLTATVSSDTNFFKLAGSRAPAVTYDAALFNAYGGTYTFPTIDQLNGITNPTASLKPGITDRHYGDWQLPGMIDMDYKFVNEDTLHAEIKLDDSSIDKITVAVKGETSTAVRIYTFDVTWSSGDNPVPTAITLSREGVVARGGTAETWAKNASNDYVVTTDFGNIFGTYDSTAKTIKIYLDDITRQGGHFAKIFASDSVANNNLIPGENVTLYVRGGEGGWADVKTLENEENVTGASVGAMNPYAKVSNSLFWLDKTKEDGAYAHMSALGSMNKAQIQNWRHLQNLDSSTSKVNAITGLTSAQKVTSAELCGHIAWPNDKTVVSVDSTDDVPKNTKEGKFNGILNSTLTTLDGKNFTVSNLAVGYYYGDEASARASSAGLFRYVDSSQELTIQKLRLKDVTVSGAADVGAFVGFNEGKLTLNTVLAMGETEAKGLIGDDAAAVNAGGLIGRSTADKTKKLTVDNSAATLFIRGKTAEGAASSVGGLLGKLESGELSMTHSYVGGHTYGGLYYVGNDASSDGKSWNIIGKVAGGLIGEISSGADAVISTSFNAATVFAASNQAGGIIGLSNGSLKPLNDPMSLVYVIAPVHNVQSFQQDEHGIYIQDDYNNFIPQTGNAGSIIGVSGSKIQGSTTNGKGVFYLPDTYTTPHPRLIATGFYNIKTSGNGNLSNAKIASYYEQTDPYADNSVLGYTQSSTENLEDVTSAYDASLKNSAVKDEYPFAIWTKFCFEDANEDGELIDDVDNPSNDIRRHYFGDWQPNRSEDTIHLHVKFYTVIPAQPRPAFEADNFSDADNDGEGDMDQDIAIQIPYTYAETLMLPYIPELDGYNSNLWDMYVDDASYSTWTSLSDDDATTNVPDGTYIRTFREEDLGKSVEFTAEDYAAAKSKIYTKDKARHINITIVSTYTSRSKQLFNLRLFDETTPGSLNYGDGEQPAYACVLESTKDESEDVYLSELLERREELTGQELPLFNKAGYRHRGYWYDTGESAVQVYETYYNPADGLFHGRVTAAAATINVKDMDTIDLYDRYEEIVMRTLTIRFVDDDDAEIASLKPYVIEFEAERGFSATGDDALILPGDPTDTSENKLWPYVSNNGTEVEIEFTPADAGTYTHSAWQDKTKQPTISIVVPAVAATDLAALTTENKEDITCSITYMGSEEANRVGYVVLFELRHTAADAASHAEDDDYNSYDDANSYVFPMNSIALSSYQYNNTKLYGDILEEHYPELTETAMNDIKGYFAGLTFPSKDLSKDVFDIQGTKFIRTDSEDAADYANKYLAKLKYSLTEEYDVKYLVVMQCYRRKFDLSYESNGGSVVRPAANGSDMDYFKVEYGCPLSFLKYNQPVDATTGRPVSGIAASGNLLAHSTLIPTYYGYTFLGWKDEDGVVINTTAPSMPARTYTVTAKWVGTAKAEFKVAFWYENPDNPDGGDDYAFAGMREYGAEANRYVGQDITSDDFKNAFNKPNPSVTSSHCGATLRGKLVDLDAAHYEFNASKIDKVDALAADGTSVLNVYFKLKKVTIVFKGTATKVAKSNQKVTDDYFYPIGGGLYLPLLHAEGTRFVNDYVESPAGEGPKFGLKDHEYFPLTKGEASGNYGWKQKYEYPEVPQDDWSTSGAYYGLAETNGQKEYVSLTHGQTRFFYNNGADIALWDGVTRYKKFQSGDDTSNCYGQVDGILYKLTRRSNNYWYYNNNTRLFAYNSTNVYLINTDNITSSNYSQRYVFDNGNWRQINRTSSNSRQYHYWVYNGELFASMYSHNGNSKHFGTLYTRINYTGNDALPSGETIYIKGSNGFTSVTDTSANRDYYAVVDGVFVQLDKSTIYNWMDGDAAYSDKVFDRLDEGSDYTGSSYYLYSTQNGYTLETDGPDWNGKTYFALDTNGGYVRLVHFEADDYSGGYWYMDGGIKKRYTDENKVYKFSSGNSEVMRWTGKWNSKFTSNNYDWKMIDRYSWQDPNENRTVTYMEGFIHTWFDSHNTYELKCTGENGVYEIRHYRQGLDGKYNEKDVSLAYYTSQYTGWHFVNKFSQFEVSSYTTSPSSTNPASFSATGGNKTTRDGQDMSNPDSGWLPLLIYHTRKSYSLTLIYYKDVIDPATGKPKMEDGQYVTEAVETTITDLYERPFTQLTGVPNLDDSYRNSNYDSSYHFQGWCLDATMEGKTVDFGPGVNKQADSLQKTMPEGGLVLYAKWAPNDSTVTFNLTQPSKGSAAWPGGTAPGSFTVPYRKSVGSEHQDECTPVVTGDDAYEFGGWQDQNGNPFYFSMPVTGNLTLTPIWLAPRELTVNVRHYTVTTDDEGNETRTLKKTTIETVYVNKSFTFHGVNDIVGFVANPAKKTEYIDTDWETDHKIPEGQEHAGEYWYDMEYVAAESRIIYDVTFWLDLPGGIQIPIEELTQNDKVSTTSCVIETFYNLPDELDGYEFVSVAIYADVNNEHKVVKAASKNPVVLVSPGTNVEVRVLVKPDTSALTQKDFYSTYTAKPQGVSEEITALKLPSLPEGVETITLDEEPVFLYNGSATEPTKAGTYTVQVRLYLTYNETKYPFWESDLNNNGRPDFMFYIDRCDIVVTSDSVTNLFYYRMDAEEKAKLFDESGQPKTEEGKKAGFALASMASARVASGVNSNYTVTGSNEDMVEYILDDRIWINPSADAFRQTASPNANSFTQNAFDYTLAADVDRDSVNVYKSYGKLYLWDSEDAYNEWKAAQPTPPSGG